MNFGMDFLKLLPPLQTDKPVFLSKMADVLQTADREMAAGKVVHRDPHLTV
jgi:hypothetical protein